jgi:hypothetical protein
MSLTSAFTTAVNAEPTMTATARSMTLPRAMNVPNPLNVLSSFALSAQRGVRRLASKSVVKTIFTKSPSRLYRFGGPNFTFRSSGRLC